MLRKHPSNRSNQKAALIGFFGFVISVGLVESVVKDILT
jgi:hypothetical protein